MQNESGDGAGWCGEKQKGETEWVIHAAGGGEEISKVEDGAVRWREIVQIGKRR